MLAVHAGDKFGRLTVQKNNGRRWTVRCACGFCFSVHGSRLLNGSLTECKRCKASIARFEEAEAYTRERDEALRTLDLGWARKNAPRAADDEVLLLALHKTRYEVTTVPAELRHESRRWMEEHGYSRRGGVPWPDAGVLPQ